MSVSRMTSRNGARPSKTSYVPRSTVRVAMPTPLVALPCGSMSMSRVGRSATATLAAAFTLVVVLPTPPFWLAIAYTRPIIPASLYLRR